MGSFGGHIASAWSASLNGGLGAKPPAGSKIRAPGQGVRGRSPPEAESFFSSRTCNGQSKFVHFAVFSAIHYNKIERCKIRAGTPQ